MVVGSNSDEDNEMDDDTVMVSMPSGLHSLRSPPNDAGFTDFDDFGGFQANDSPPNGSEEADPQTAAEAGQWNAFSDPTDAGRASMSGKKPHA